MKFRSVQNATLVLFLKYFYNYTVKGGKMSHLVCPICGNHVENFDEYDMTYTIANKVTRLQYPDAICQVCKSDVRHRFALRFLQDKTHIFKKRLKVLHVAPEYWLANVFLNMDIEYHPVDINCERFKHFEVAYADITGLSYPDNSFDAVILIHVLEHIPEDDKAIRELFRVLKPGGWMLLSVPTGEAPTQEGLHLSPAQRKNLFGIEDHYRLYGLDLKDKIEEKGFVTQVFTPEDISGNWYNRNHPKGYRPSDKYLFFSVKPEIKETDSWFSRLKRSLIPAVHTS